MNQTGTNYRKFAEMVREMGYSFSIDEWKVVKSLFEQKKALSIVQVLVKLHEKGTLR